MRSPAQPLRTVRLFLTMLAVAGAFIARADVRTLTDKLGRTIKADVISVQEGEATIRREDGSVFKIKIDTLSDADQAALRELAGKQAKESVKLGPDALKIDLSRAMFKTEKSPDAGGTTASEEWGFNITVTNQTAKEIKGLRVEYILFSKPNENFFPDSKGKPLTRTRGKAALEPLKQRDKVQLRTDPLTISRTRLPADTKFIAPDGKRLGTRTDKEMVGVWLRFYSGDDLVTEISAPETLLQKEKW